MPYTVGEMQKDSRFKGMPRHGMEIFAAAFEAALKQYDGDESKAFATAWAAVKHKYKKQADGTWAPFSAGKEGGMPEETLIERDARLFESGAYPDKDIEVTDDDLDGLVSNFKPAPVKVEHGDTPFDGALGTLKSIYRKGKELWGKIGFTPPAWALIDAANARKLSVSLTRDKTSIPEVSLVKNPRIAGAQVFDDRIEIEGGEVPTNTTEAELAFAREVLTLVTRPTSQAEGSDIHMPEKTDTNVQKDDMTYEDALTALRRFRPDNSEARAIFDSNVAIIQMAQDSREEVRKAGEAARASMRAIQQANTDVTIERLKREGKLTAAVEGFARAILSKRPLKGTEYGSDETVTFSGKNDAGEDVEVPMHYAECFAQFLERMPKVVDFGEIARAEAEKTGPTPELLEMYKKFNIDPKSDAAKQVLAEMRR